ncbi:hypothetical protein LQZ18_12255 [Lachnospiraceae bacterium ZAX-1]
MIKMFTAFTNRMEDPEVVAKEIYAQLEHEKNRLKNTAGIVAFDNGYAQGGVYETVVVALPFDVVCKRRRRDHGQ